MKNAKNPNWKCDPSNGIMKIMFVFSYKILAVTNDNGNDVMDENEFQINPKYRNRPMAYLRAAKTILYNEVSITSLEITSLLVK